jgi:predicted nucleic acid-binding protein
VILIDTSVWIDFLRTGDRAVEELLDTGRVLAHPFVIGEVALGHLRQRRTILTMLQGLPQVTTATDAEVLSLIERQSLAGLGIGYVDAHLLVSTRLTAGSALWTRDKRFAAIADRLSLGWSEG